MNPCERFQCKVNLSWYMATMLQACSKSVCESQKDSCGAWMTACGQITFAKEVVLCPSAVPHARGRSRVSAD